MKIFDGSGSGKAFRLQLRLRLQVKRPEGSGSGSGKNVPAPAASASAPAPHILSIDPLKTIKFDPLQKKSSPLDELCSMFVPVFSYNQYYTLQYIATHDCITAAWVAKVDRRSTY